MAKHDPIDLEAHFRFGANWASFARLVNEDRVRAAVHSLRELVGPDLGEKSFLDIGCGSGLSSLAAAKLGAKSIVATDIDPESTKTAAELLGSHLTADSFTIRTVSIFDMEPGDFGSFDVVHSWGVLHHTGAMWRAIERAAQFTKPHGMFVLAIYKKTPCCVFWRMEKKFYSRAPRAVQRFLLRLYGVGLYAAQLMLFRNPWRRAAEYRVNRGMDQEHDFHDWLGGYPYESATPGEIDRFMSARGFHLLRANRLESGIGLFGTGCAEYVYERRPAEALS